MKKTNAPHQENKNIMLLTYVVLALFLGMMGYFGYFLQVKSEDVINSSYNARLDRFSDRILRGRIFSSDGLVLAETQNNALGGEVRVYPFANAFSHVVGYTSKGKTGVESLGNFYLLSSHVNLFEQIWDQLSGQKSPGDDVITTLDARLQMTAYEELGDRKGAVVCLEPGTGKLLAMVSKPDYDPNPASLDAVWETLIQEENDQAQLLNRATQGLYPPGSVFKIVTALEAMRENTTGWKEIPFDCSGVYAVEGYSIKCYHNNVHGLQNLELSFANSCNGAFASLGLSLDLASMEELAFQLLFNTELPLALPYAKSTYSMKAGADTWEILQTSIGQGMTQVTPIHMAMMTAAIANGGILMKPYVIERVNNAAGEEVKKFLPSSAKSLMTAQEAGQLGDLMRQVVITGTGSALRDAPYSSAGKTGSAEFETGKETHAWFTGYAPAEEPKIVVTVIVEEGGSGGQAAAPVARKLFDQYLLR